MQITIPIIDKVEYNAAIRLRVEQLNTKKANAPVAIRLTIVLLISLSSVTIHTHPNPAVYNALLHESELSLLYFSIIPSH